MVAGCLAVLATLIGSALFPARRRGGEADCRSRLSALGTALQQYASLYAGTLPPGSVYGWPGDGHVQAHGWSVTGRLLPFLERDVAASLNYSIRPEAPANLTGVSRRIGSLLCPADPNAARGGFEQFGTPIWGTNYAWCMGDWYVAPGFGERQAKIAPRSAFTVNSSVNWSKITDGLARTMIAAEVKTDQFLGHCDQALGIRDPEGVPPPSAQPDKVAPEYRFACEPEVATRNESEGGESRRGP